jgi:hypothetical protein
VGASCNNTDDFHDIVTEHYYMILLKKWRESVDRQYTPEQKPLDTSEDQQRNISEADIENTVRKAVMDIYNIDVEKGCYIGYWTYKRNEKHWQIQYQKSLGGKQIWVLISAENGRLLSTHITKSKLRKSELRDILRQQEEKKRLDQERPREIYANYIYKLHIEIYETFFMKLSFNTDSAFACPLPFDMLYNFYHDKVNSVYLQKIDSVHYRRIESAPTERKNEPMYINRCSFRQTLKTLYGLEDNTSVDSIKAVKIATAAVAQCYGSEITPFMARLMGDSKEHWMIYCFPTILDDIEKQKICYALLIRDYEEGKDFNTGCGFYFGMCRGCPVVFIVLVSRENGQVLTINAV